MKKSLIALAVLGAVAGAAQAQSSVTIYGLIDEGVTYSSNVATGNVNSPTGGKVGLTSGVIQGSRLGFKGVEDLGNGLKAVFQLEAGFKANTGALNGGNSNNNSNGLFNRKSVVGLSSDTAGTVLLGRQTDLLDDIGSYTSVKDFGNVVGTAHALDRTEGVRTQNSIRYNSPNFSGFTASAIYGFGGQAGSTTAGQSFGLGGIYANGPLAAFVSYYQSKVGTPNATGVTGSDVAIGSYPLSGVLATGDTALKTFTLGASYQAGPARLYGNWSRSANQAINLATTTGDLYIPRLKLDMFELGTDYALTAPLHLLASVQYGQATIGSSDNGKGKLTQYNLGTDYWLSKRTDVYGFVSYQQTKNGYGSVLGTGIFDPSVVNSSGDANQTSVSVGIRHKF